MTETEEEQMVTAYLQTFNHRLSGAAFKIAFEVATTAAASADRRVRITVGQFQAKTGLSRNTVLSAIAEAKTRNAIEQVRDGACYVYSPNFEPVQNLTSPKIEPVQITDETGLFSAWAAANKSSRQLTAADNEIISSILTSFSVDECRQAIDGWAAREFREFAEVLKDADAVEAGIMFHEFITSEV